MFPPIPYTGIYSPYQSLSTISRSNITAAEGLLIENIQSNRISLRIRKGGDTSIARHSLTRQRVSL